MLPVCPSQYRPGWGHTASLVLPDLGFELTSSLGFASFGVRRARRDARVLGIAGGRELRQLRRRLHGSKKLGVDDYIVSSAGTAFKSTAVRTSSHMNAACGSATRAQTDGARPQRKERHSRRSGRGVTRAHMCRYGAPGALICRRSVRAFGARRSGADRQFGAPQRIRLGQLLARESPV
jgi:hypothetical protein